MTKVIEIKSKIRDSQIHKIEFDYLNRCVMIKLKKNDVFFELILKEVSELDIFDNSISSEYISHLKLFKSKNNYFLSLDPYDETLESLDEKDNYKFIFKDYLIKNQK